MTTLPHNHNDDSKGKDKFNPLIAIPAPKRVPDVMEALQKIPEYTKMWIRNYPESQAYLLMQQYFLENPSYTHLCICPYDLIPERKGFDYLVQDITEGDGWDKYPVISGYCNLQQEGWEAAYSNIVIDKLIDIDANKRNYQFAALSALEKMNGKIIKVEFSGFPLMFIRRDILEKKHIMLMTDGQWNGQPASCGACVDVVFCWDCHNKNIPIYVDTRCRFLHLKWNSEENGRIGGEGRNSPEGPSVMLEPPTLTTTTSTTIDTLH